MHLVYIAHKSNYNIYILRPIITESHYNSFVSFFRASPNSQYEKLVRRIADLLFYCGENLTSLFHNFYSEEYDDFPAFLENELDFDEELISHIMEKRINDENLWRIKVSDYETYNFSNIFDTQIWEDNLLLETIDSILARCNG